MRMMKKYSFDSFQAFFIVFDHVNMQACMRWLKYTTNNPQKRSFNVPHLCKEWMFVMNWTTKYEILEKMVRLVNLTE